MHLNIAVRLRDLDTHGNIKRETRHLCENMLGIKQSRDHVTNQSLYQLTGQVPLRETIRERQLKFIGHCIRMPKDELANRFVIYESRIRSSFRPGAPRTTYLNQISSHLLQSGEKALEDKPRSHFLGLIGPYEK